VLEPHLGQQRRRPRGRITYTQWLNEGGTLEADLTVTKLDDERFWWSPPTPRTATC
jgi:glycine cleavage system aminomethyltransferase T